MPRYIDADALLQKRVHAKAYGPEMYVIGQGYVMDAPTADVAPVVHGRWLPIKDDYGQLYCGCCSNCGCEPMRNPFRRPWMHCPNCGARMDGQEGDGV